jgi:hypothetical protein
MKDFGPCGPQSLGYRRAKAQSYARVALPFRHLLSPRRGGDLVGLRHSPPAILRGEPRRENNE